MQEAIHFTWIIHQTYVQNHWTITGLSTDRHRIRTHDLAQSSTKDFIENWIQLSIFYKLRKVISSYTLSAKTELN